MCLKEFQARSIGFIVIPRSFGCAIRSFKGFQRYFRAFQRGFRGFHSIPEKLEGIFTGFMSIIGNLGGFRGLSQTFLCPEGVSGVSGAFKGIFRGVFEGLRGFQRAQRRIRGFSDTF